MPKYSAILQRTLSNSSTGGAYCIGVLGAASAAASGKQIRRGKVSQVSWGSESTPADNGLLLVMQQVTALGTFTAVTPNAADQQDQGTTSFFMGQCGQNNTADTTPSNATAGLVWGFSINQRTTLIWTAKPGYELIWPAAASNGFAWKTPTINTGTPLGTITVFFEE